MCEDCTNSVIEDLWKAEEALGAIETAIQGAHDAEMSVWATLGHVRGIIDRYKGLDGYQVL